MKSATAYKRSNEVLLHSNSKTTIGVWITSPPYLRLSLDSSPTNIGIAVLEVLNSSKESVPHPKQDEWKGVFNPLLELAGVKSISAFERGVRSCGIEIETEELSIIPYRRAASGKGFEPIEEERKRIPIKTPVEEIGKCLMESFNCWGMKRGRS